MCVCVGYNREYGQRSYIHKIGKRAPKSETETFGIVGRFYRFED